MRYFLALSSLELPLETRASPTPGEIALIAIAVVVLAVMGIVFAVAARRRRLVRESSLALLHLADLNSAFAASVGRYPVIRKSFSVRMNTKTKYDKFDLGNFLRYSVLESESWFEHEISVRLTALGYFEDYHNRFEQLSRQMLGATADPRMAPQRYAAIEAKLFHRAKLPHPDALADITATVRYTSPKGQNSYVRHATWDFHQLRLGLQTAQAARARQSTVQASRQRERQLLTPQMRVDVLRRDRYSCRMCGARAEDGIALEIDHITPISWDGLTRPENLQTLCHDCNRGKGARFRG